MSVSISLLGRSCKPCAVALCIALLCGGVAARAATWQTVLIDSDVAGGISATRFSDDKIAVAYARPGSSEIKLATVTAHTNITHQTLSSTIRAQHVELSAVSSDDDDLYVMCDDGSGQLKWARKNEAWTWRDVEDEAGVSNSFALQLYKLLGITSPSAFYRYAAVQRLEMYYSFYYPYSNSYSLFIVIVASNDFQGDGCVLSSAALDVYEQVVAYCRGDDNDVLLGMRILTGWTNFVVMGLTPFTEGKPPVSFEQGDDHLPRVAAYRYTTIPQSSSAYYFDVSAGMYNAIELQALGLGNGAAPALKLNHIGRPLAAYYWATDGTVHCSTRSGSLGGLLWTHETCGTGTWDGGSAGIDLVPTVSNTYVFFVDTGSSQLFMSVGDFVPPDKIIHGHVTDENTGLPISNAFVTAIESGTYVAALTDVSGWYEFDYLPTGRYAVACAADGYYPVATNIDLRADNSPYTVDFALVPEPGLVVGLFILVVVKIKTVTLTGCSAALRAGRGCS